MSQTKEFYEARQLFLAQFGNALVTNTYLKIALALVSLTALGLLVLNFRTHQIVQNFKPLVIRIDQIGRAEAIAYQSLAYKPQDAEMKYFLSQFCKLHYARNRATLKDSFAQSLYFVEGLLANTIIDGFKKSKILESYLSDPNLPEIDIDIRNIVLEEIQNPPYKAKVDIEKVYLSRVDRSEIKREFSTVSVVFAFKQKVENDLITLNPLGLTIRYFREDRAFQ
ncbi:MAG: VirB8/TrbF family protein [Acidobacteriota bacterium]